MSGATVGLNAVGANEGGTGDGMDAEAEGAEEGDAAEDDEACGFGVCCAIGLLKITPKYAAAPNVAAIARTISGRRNRSKIVR